MPITNKKSYARLTVEELEQRVVPVVPTFSFGATAYSVTEPAGNAAVVVQRSSSIGTASVDITATDGTATSPGDYSFTSQSLSFLDGQSSVTVNVSIVSDATAEPDEDLTLTLSNPSAGTNLGAAYLTTVTIANSVPTAQGASLSVSHDQMLTIDFNDYITDADGDALTFAYYGGPTHGALVQNEDGTYNYYAAPGWTGTDNFTIIGNDGFADSGPGGLIITATNSAPTAFDDTFSLKNDATFVVPTDSGILGNDSDGDNDPFTAALTSGPSHGSFSLNADGSFSYTPNTGFVGVDGFAYQASDGLASSTAAVVLNVHANAPPLAGDAAFSVTHGQTLTVSVPGVLGYAYDPYDDPVTASLVSAPLHGAATLNSDGSFVYTPNSGFRGTDSFTYVANDGAYDSDPAVISISVENSAPMAPASFFSTPAGQSLVVTGSGVLTNAVDLEGDSLTAQIDTSTSHGSLDLNNDGSFTYAPNTGFTGNDTFTFEASDGFTTSSPVLVTISVVGAAPIANADEFALETNSTYTSSASGVLWNDATTGTDALSAVLDAGPSHGNVSFNSDGTFAYTPNQDYEGPDSFSYYASANSVLSAAPAQVAINVVRVTLGFPQASWTQGPWIPINANDDNGSNWQSISSTGVLSGNTTAQSPTVTVPSSPILVAGVFVMGNGIPANTTILSVNANGTITLSANATATAQNVALTFDTRVGIPQVRDFSYRQPLPANRTDPQLKPVNLTIVGAGANGLIQLEVENSGPDLRLGQVRLWSDQRKTRLLNPGLYPVAGPTALPNTIYVEGIEPTGVLFGQQQQDPSPDVTIRVTYWELRPGFALPRPVASASVGIGISPVITNFTTTTGQARFFNRASFLNGFTTGDFGGPVNPGQQLPNLVTPGANFSAQIFNPNMGGLGQPQYIQNMTMENSGTFLSPGNGFGFAGNVPAQNWRWLNPAGNVASLPNVPMMDTGFGPGPFYLPQQGQTAGQQVGQSYQLSSQDTPGANMALLLLRRLRQNTIVTSVGFSWNFTMSVTWQMPAGGGPLNPAAAPGATVPYTLATDRWGLYFSAMNLNNNWANDLDALSTVWAQNAVRSHSDLKIVGPSANLLFNIN